MGTRFMATKECPIPDTAKQKMVESPETSTVLVMQTLGNPSRVLKTPWAEKILEMENTGASLEELIPMIEGKAGREGWMAGNLDQGMMPVGQAVGRITDVPTVAELVERIIEEAKDVKGKLDSLF